MPIVKTFQSGIALCRHRVNLNKKPNETFDQMMDVINEYDNIFLCADSVYQSFVYELSGKKVSCMFVIQMCLHDDFREGCNGLVILKSLARSVTTTSSVDITSVGTLLLVIANNRSVTITVVLDAFHHVLSSVLISLENPNTVLIASLLINNAILVRDVLSSLSVEDGKHNSLIHTILAQLVVLTSEVSESKREKARDKLSQFVDADPYAPSDSDDDDELDYVDPTLTVEDTEEGTKKEAPAPVRDAPCVTINPLTILNSLSFPRRHVPLAPTSMLSSRPAARYG